MSEETKNTDSFDMPENTGEAKTETTIPSTETNVDTVEAQSNADLAAVLGEMRKLQAEVQSLRASKGENEDLISDSGERKPAELMTLATIDDMPIIDMRLEKELDIDHRGNKYIKHYNAVCKVYGKDEPVTITYGVESEPNDFINLPRKTFKLTNQDTNDLSGASKVLKGQVMSKDGTVPEVDRSSGVPVRTGKMVELVTKRDVRWYTIIVNEETGETCELHEDKIYR